MALLWPAFGPDLANRSGPPKCHHSMPHVGQIIIPDVPRCGPDLGRHYVAIWVRNRDKSGRLFIKQSFVVEVMVLPYL